VTKGRKRFKKGIIKLIDKNKNEEYIKQPIMAQPQVSIIIIFVNKTG
jgi:hypothetical protein